MSSSRVDRVLSTTNYAKRRILPRDLPVSDNAVTVELPTTTDRGYLALGPGLAVSTQESISSGIHIPPSIAKIRIGVTEGVPLGILRQEGEHALLFPAAH